MDSPTESETRGKSPLLGRGGDVLRATLTMVGRQGLSGLERDLLDVEQEVAFFFSIARPLPGDKSPRIADVRACHQRLIEELDAASPRAILSCGAGACASLSCTDPKLIKATPITAWRGLMRYVELPTAGLVPWVATIAPASVSSRTVLYRDFAADVYKAWHQPAPLPQPRIMILEDLP